MTGQREQIETSRERSGLSCVAISLFAQITIEHMMPMASFVNDNSIVIVVLLFVAVVIPVAQSALNNDNKKLDWIVGKWRSEFGGKVSH